MALQRRRLYLFGAILAILALLALGLQWGVRSYLRPRIGALLQRIIVDGSDSLYRFSQSSCQVDLWTGSLALQDCTLSLDSTRYVARLDGGGLPPLTVVMHLREIRVSGLKVWTWLFHKRVDCGRLVLVGAEVSLYRHPGFKRNGGVKGPPTDLYSLIQPLVRSIRVGEVLLGDVRVAYDNGDSARPFRWAFQRCDLRLRDILVDSSTVSDDTRFAYARSFTIGMEKVSMLVGRQLYRINLGKLTYDFGARQALLSDFSLQSVQDAPAFYRAVGHETDRYSLHVSKVSLGGLDIEELLLYNFLHADTVNLLAPSVTISHDRTLPFAPREKQGNYPNQLVLKAPLDILVRKIHTEGGRISYAEKNAKTQRTGTLTFEGVNGLISNMTNVPEAIARDPWWTVGLHASFMGQSPVAALFSFDLRNTSGRFEVKAHLEDLDAPALDPLTQALASTSLSSLHVDSLETQMEGDEHGARASVRMRYDHLRVELLRPHGLSKKPLLSMLANGFLVRADNPGSGAPERVARDVSQPKDPYKSFFNLIWKTLYAGVREIAVKPLF